MAEIVLAGCTPEPLMSYLKALGVFRLVAEQTDPDARLCWRSGLARIHTTLDRAKLQRFFTETYAPTPIIGPWGARSGFYPGSSESSAREALNAIVAGAETQPRLAPYRDVIVSMRELLRRFGFSEKVKDDEKLTLMQLCRNELPDAVLPWLDAVFVLTDDSRRFPPLLGTGGNEGSGSYVSTFAQVVVSLLIDDQKNEGVANALFGEFTSSLGGLAVGHFNPGAVGGANSSQGFQGGGGVNAWDYLLAVEGSLLFAGAAARRYGASTDGPVAFPFCVQAVPVGYGSESEKEAAKSTRAEMWLPLWSSPSGLAELSHLFTEGRAQLGRRQARNAIEFALALANLGVSKGIDSFVRYAFVMRNGLSYLATPLGRIAAGPRPQARLLNDPPLVDWVERFRDACRAKDKAPERYRAALRQIDRTMFEFANRSERGNDAKCLLEIVCALGRAERTLAYGLSFCKENYIRPLRGLDPQWIEQADDDSPEFHLATSLAGIRPCRAVGSIRAFLEPVQETPILNWVRGSTSAVWSKQPLAANLAGVFRRRLYEAFHDAETWERAGVPVWSPRPCRAADVVAFLREEIDERRLADFVWGLATVDWSRVEFRLPKFDQTAVPFEFGVPRMLVGPGVINPDRARWSYESAGPRAQVHAKPDPNVFHALSAARCSAVAECVDRAARRLKSAGRLVHGYRSRRLVGRSLNVESSIPADRLLASMLIPLSNRELQSIANAVLYPPDNEE